MNNRIEADAYSSIIDILKKSDSVAVFMHINSDGDCIGSALALYNFLINAGKTAYLYLPAQSSPLPKKFAFLKSFEKFSATNPPCEVAVAVDCADSARLSDDNLKAFFKSKTRIAIDHHESHIKYADYTLLEPYAASTTQIMYKVLSKYDKKYIDRDIASMLYAGLVTDSGSFAFDSVSRETFETAMSLMDYGIDIAEITRNVFKNIRLEIYNLKNRVLSKTKLYLENTLGIITFDTDDFLATNTTESDTEGIIQSLLAIDTVELAISIAEVRDKAFKVSFRSKTRVNVSAFAKRYGGGGHKRAAGCRLYGYKEDVYNKLLSAAKEILSDD